MPIFEYRCRNCGKVTEKIIRENQQEITCPFCGQTAERIISLCSDGSKPSSLTPSNSSHTTGYG